MIILNSGYFLGHPVGLCAFFEAKGVTEYTLRGRDGCGCGGCRKLSSRDKNRTAQQHL